MKFFNEVKDRREFGAYFSNRATEGLYYECHPQKYDTLMSHRYTSGRKMCEAALEKTGLDQFRRSLDIACGTGHITRALSQFTAGEVIGLDTSEPMLEVARNKEIPNAMFTLGDMNVGSDYPDGEFDCITLMGGSRNIMDTREFHARVEKLLSSQGCAAFCYNDMDGEVVRATAKIMENVGLQQVGCIELFEESPRWGDMFKEKLDIVFLQQSER